MPTPFDGLARAFIGTLGQTVTITPNGGGSREIAAIFVARSVEDYGLIQPQPIIHVTATDAADVTDGDAVSVAGATYVARGFKPDGHGMVAITLEAVNG